MKLNETLVRSVREKEISIFAGLDVGKMRPTQITQSERGKNKAERWVLLTLFDLLDSVIPEAISV